MAPRGRPPGTKTLVDRQLGRNVSNPVLPAGDSFMIPNHSGIRDHPEFFLRLDEIENPDNSKTFNMSNKILKFTYQAPTPAGDDEGAFEIEAKGGFTGDLVHLHQHIGNPGAGTTVLGIECEDSDVCPLHVESAGKDVLFEGGGLTISHTVPIIIVRDNNSTGTGVVATMEFQDSTETTVGRFGFFSAISSAFVIANTITDGDITFSWLDGAVTHTAGWSASDSTFDMNTHKIKNLVDPTANQEAATKKYVDDQGHINTLTKHLTIESPTDAEDFSWVYFPSAVTITALEAVLVGSSTPSVTINPKHHTDRSNAGNGLLSAATAVTNTTTGASVSLAGGDVTIPSASFLWLETTAQSGTVDSIHLTITYTED